MRLRDPRLVVCLGLLLAAGSLVACQPAADEDAAATEAAADDAGESATTADATAVSDTGVVDVLVQDYSFTAPASLRSGWNTFRLENRGQEPHFLILWRLPEDKTFDDYTAEVVPAFVESVTHYREGATDREGMLQELGGMLPEWFITSVDGAGGPGFTGAGHVSETTVHLEPGNYVMECYAQSAEGEFHGALGMLRPLVVTGESTGMAAPDADVEITLSNYEIAVQGELTPGEHTIGVTVAEDPEGLLGHDIHLVRLAEDTDLQQVVAWMDWIDAMRAPAPAEFLGGAEEMTAGNTAYFTVTLDPGRYAWVSEAYGAQGMVQEFTVAESGS